MGDAIYGIGLTSTAAMRDQPNPNWQRFFAELPVTQHPLNGPTIYHANNGWSGSTYWRWNSRQGPLLMKVWPSDGPTHSDHIDRHRKLQYLSGFYPHLALPISDQKGQTVRSWFGDLWAELMPWLEGSPILAKPSVEVICQTFQAMARLHHQWRSHEAPVYGPSQAVLSRLEQLRNIRNKRILEPDTRIWNLSDQAKPVIRDQFMEVCKLAKALTDRAILRLEPFEHQPVLQQTVLRDARPDHFLFTDQKLSGIIDFGAIGTDSVAVDLARLTGDWFPGDKQSIELALMHYRYEYSVTFQELDLIAPLALAGAILGGLAWVDLHFKKQRTAGRELEFQKALTHALNRLRAQWQDYRSDLIHS